MQEEVLNMPVQHLGQLKPTMQQQIALQEALLALQRRDEELRRKAAKPKTALAHRLGTVDTHQKYGPSYAGPTPTLGGAEKTPSVTPSYFRPRLQKVHLLLRQKLGNYEIRW